MNTRTQTIWNSFCGELIVEPTDDMREALATAVREIVNEFQYYHFGPGEDMVVDARILYELAEELEK
jgi:hypothetical protein